MWSRSAAVSCFDSTTPAGRKSRIAISLALLFYTTVAAKEAVFRLELGVAGFEYNRQ